MSLLSIFTLFIGYNLGYEKAKSNLDENCNQIKNLSLPARSTIESATINEVVFSTDLPRTLTVKVKYNFVKGIESLLTTNIIDGVYEAEVSGDLFLYGSDKNYSISPQQDSYTFDLNSPKELLITFDLEESNIPFNGLFPDNIQSINVHFSFASEFDIYYLSASIVNEIK